MNISELPNNSYIKGRFCGIHSKNFVSKKDGSSYDFHYVVLEESITAQKKFFQLNREAVSKQLEKKLSDDRLVGKTVVFPFYVSSFDGGINYFYSGSEPPIIIN